MGGDWPCSPPRGMLRQEPPGGPVWWSGESSGFAGSRPGAGEDFAALRSLVGLGLVRARPQDGGWGDRLRESRGGDRKK